MTHARKPRRNKAHRPIVPCRDSIVGDTRYMHSDNPGRGATPVTVMDFWFPMHAYLAAAQQGKGGAA